MHWDRQAAQGELSGTQDRIAKNLEIEAISKFVQDGMRILDVGCGDGETAWHLYDTKKVCVIGVDSSEKMIEVCMNKQKERGIGFGCPQPPSNFTHSGIGFIEKDVKKLSEWNPKPYDLIYTERTLINLPTWEEQRQAIVDIGTLLKPGGLYLMCECFQEGLMDINALRIEVGLEPILPPWHNRYLHEGEIIHSLTDRKDPLHPVNSKLILEDRVDYSANYYFLSRVVEAYVAAQEGREPDYNSPINRIGLLMQTAAVCMRGQGQLWVWRKV